MMRRAILTVLGLAIMAQPAWAEIGRIKRSVGATAVERGKAKLTPPPVSSSSPATRWSPARTAR
ncbi:hypothetical protein ACFSTI_19395 [Rhizorhabdus histidinilytica]